MYPEKSVKFLHTFIEVLPTGCPFLQLSHQRRGMHPQSSPVFHDSKSARPMSVNNLQEKKIFQAEKNCIRFKWPKKEKKFLKPK